jgi:hypothetical protein
MVVFAVMCLCVTPAFAQVHVEGNVSGAVSDFDLTWNSVAIAQGAGGAAYEGWSFFNAAGGASLVGAADADAYNFFGIAAGAEASVGLIAGAGVNALIGVTGAGVQGEQMTAAEVGSFNTYAGGQQQGGFAALSGDAGFFGSASLAAGGTEGGTYVAQDFWGIQYEASAMTWTRSGAIGDISGVYAQGAVETEVVKGWAGNFGAAGSEGQYSAGGGNVAAGMATSYSQVTQVPGFVNASTFSTARAGGF